MAQPWGLAGAIPFFVASLVLLAVGIRSLQKRWREESVEEEAARLKQFISRQRHDWMNHVQVLLGYLSLDKRDRIKEYLENLAEHAGKERMASECTYPPLAVTLTTLQYREWQRQVQLALEAPLSFMKREDEIRLCRILERVIPWLEQTLKTETDPGPLRVTAVREPQAAVLLMEVDGGTDPLHSLHTRSHEWGRLREDMKEFRGDIRLLTNGRGIEIRCPFSRNRAGR
ncbi:Spo0B domain-containing protein [Staphylospora marina]|uniref:Spo0B domain-containing protein n=1 Tax=Staphylospora marina TaxID=2490858 RepID=UPI0013DDE49A|nr:Spo0B domain-containing protein [Staphylospora marina]